MTDKSDDPQSSAIPASNVPPTDGLPEDLPPITPPSAGFIMQLFVVPAIIVMVIIGLWALFGRMVAEEENLTQVFLEVKSNNALRRGPSMHKLAQLLQVDMHRKPENKQYVNNPQVAQQAADLLMHWMKNVPVKAEDKKDVLEAQIFLTRTLSLFETPDVVIPALQQAMHIPVENKSGDQKEQIIRDTQQSVRKSAIASIALLADRANQRKRPIDNDSLVTDISDIALDSSEDPTIRQVATYALGLFSSDLSKQKLLPLLKTADQMTRLNAAVALSRKKSTAGYEVLAEALSNATSFSETKTTHAERFEHRLKLKNSLLAVKNLADKWNADQSANLIKSLTSLATDHPVSELRLLATQTLEALQGKK